MDLNATQAAKRAGFSIKTAASQGQRLLKNVEIQAAIQKRQDVIAARLEVTQERLIAEYAKIGFANMEEYATWGPGGVKVNDSDQLLPGASEAVAEVSEHVTFNKDGEGTKTLRFKLHDKKGALDSLAKHLGMFIDRQEINVNTHWRFTIGKGYDETESDAPKVVDSVVSKALRDPQNDD